MQRLVLLFGVSVVTICVSSEIVLDRSSNKDSEKDISKQTSEYIANTYDTDYGKVWEDYWKQWKNYLKNTGKDLSNEIKMLP